VTTSYPASISQRLLWQASRMLAAGSAATPRYYRISELDRDALQRALDGLRDRHESLRTRLVGAGPRLTQEVSDPGPFPVEWVTADAAGLTAEGSLGADIPVPEPGREVVARVWLTPEDSLLLINVDHLLTDAWSARILGAELMHLYTAHRDGREPDLPAPGWQYGQFAHWQVERLRGDVLERLQAAWLSRIAGAEPARLPNPPGRVLRTERTSAVRRIPPSPELSGAFRALCAAGGTTLSCAALAVFFLELQMITGQDDLCVGSLFANRADSRVLRTTGLFANLLPLRLSAGAGRTVVDVLRAAHQTMSHALAHQELPMSLLPSGTLPRASAIGVHDVVFHVLPTAVVAEDTGPAAAPTLAPRRARSLAGGGSRFDFELALVPYPAAVRSFVRYATDRFSAEWVDDFCALFREVARVAAGDPEQSLRRLAQRCTRESLVLTGR
jgi:hypothetical protein